MTKSGETFEVVNRAIDLAFINQKYELNFFDYLQTKKCKRADVLNFISSTVGCSISDQIEELDLYLSDHKNKSYIKEAYDWMGENRARIVRDYLNNILEDAKRYEKSKRPGRKPKSTTNK